MIKKFNEFIKEGFEDEFENIEGFTPADLYNMGAEQILKAAEYLGDSDLEDEDPEVVINALKEEGSEKALEIAEEIEETERMISALPSEDDWSEEENEEDDW